MLLGSRASHRPGYTILEIMLASMIAVILLGALYVALDLMLNRMDSSREQVGGNDLARNIVTTRMAADLAGTLGPLPPKSGGVPSEEAAPTNGSTPAPTTESTPTTPTTPTDPAAEPTDPTGMPTSAVTTGADIPFSAGVIGTDKQLTVFVSRLPDAVTNLEAAANPDIMLGADIKRITYYLATDGSGLCRQLRPWVTSDGVWNSADPDTSTQETDIIAPEVRDVTFEYYDGGTWQSSWDGSQLSSDGVTILGPPRAIRVTLTLDFPGRNGAQKQVQQVIPIRAAVGNYMPPTEGTETTTTPTTEGM